MIISGIFVVKSNLHVITNDCRKAIILKKNEILIGEYDSERDYLFCITQDGIACTKNWFVFNLKHYLKQIA